MNVWVGHAIPKHFIKMHVTCVNPYSQFQPLFFFHGCCSQFLWKMDHTTNGPTALARPADRESLQLFVKLPDLKNVQLTNGFDLAKRSNGNRVFSQNRKTKSSFLVPQNSCHCSLLGLQSKCIPRKTRALWHWSLALHKLVQVFFRRACWTMALVPKITQAFSIGIS